MSGLGAEFENEPLEELIDPPVAPTETLVGLIIPPERLVIGGHGKPLVATPLLPKEGVAEKERAATEDCPKAREDDFLEGETLTGFGKAFLTIEGVTLLAGEALTGFGKAFLTIEGVKLLAGADDFWGFE